MLHSYKKKKRTIIDDVTIYKTIMNSALYIPNLSGIVDIFKPKHSTAPIIDKKSNIELTSPIQSVVERAKSELKRINMQKKAKPIISSNNIDEAQLKIKRLCKKKTRRKKRILLKKKEDKTRTNKSIVNESSKKKLQLSNNKSELFKDIFG